MKCVYSEKRGWELLSIAASLKAQKLAATAQGNIAVLREAQRYFIISARYTHYRFISWSKVTHNRFGQRASSYSQVMDACKRYWNTCQTGITSMAGRAMLLNQLVELLQILSTLSSRRTIVRIGIHRDYMREVNTLQKTDSEVENELTDQAVGLTNEEDLTLRVSMYSVVLQTHTDMVKMKM